MIRIEDVKQYEKAAATEKMLTLVFAMFGRDKASELRFDFRPDRDEVRLWYWIRDELFELVPPPVELWPEIIRTLLKTTKPAPGQKRPKSRGFRAKPAFPDFPFAGILPVQYGDKVVNFDILFFRGRTGEHIWIEKATPIDVSPAATAFFHEWNAKRLSLK